MYETVLTCFLVHLGWGWWGGGKAEGSNSFMNFHQNRYLGIGCQIAALLLKPAVSRSGPAVRH